MKEDLISVIVPIYNVEKYLEKCIKSIINQTYKNLEIILVDDGSPDNCGKICDEFAERDKRIKVIHKENGGLSDARNFGLNVASGDYISFVDSDDYINEKMYEILFSEIKKNDSDIVFCDYIKFSEDNINNFVPEKYDIIIHDKYSYLNLYYDNGHKHEKAVVAWGKLYKRKLFDNIIYPKGKRGEDELTHYKIFYGTDKIVEVKLKLYYYLVRKDSLSSDWYTKPRHYMVEALIEELEFFKRNKDKKLEIIVATKLLRELKHNYNLKQKSTEKYLSFFKKYFEEYKDDITYNKIIEFYKKNFS